MAEAVGDIPKREMKHDPTTQYSYIPGYSIPPEPLGAWTPKNPNSRKIDDPANYRVFRTKSPRDSSGGNKELHEAVLSSGGYYSDAQEGYIFPKGAEDTIKNVAFKLGDDKSMNHIFDARGKPVTGRDAVGRRFGNMRDVVDTFPGREKPRFKLPKKAKMGHSGTYWIDDDFEIVPKADGSADMYYHTRGGKSLVAQGQIPHSNPKTRQSKNIKRLELEAQYLRFEPDEIENQSKKPRLIQKADTVQFIFNQIKKAISV
jgi:hypothetical protein